MRAVVLGAGGLGSSLAAVLWRAGRETDLVARGEHGNAVEREGLRVARTRDAFVAWPRCVGSAAEALARATDGDAGATPVDAVILAVKGFSIGEVARDLRQLAEAGAVVVPVLNGVDVTETLRAAGLPADRVVDGVAYMTAFRVAPGVTEPRGEHRRLVIGSADGAAAGALARVTALFDGSEVEVTVSDDVRAEQWRKMAVVCSLAVLCGLTDAELGRVRGHRLGRSLQESAVAEVMAVGRARGVALPADSEARVHEVLDAFPADFYPSVLHDLRSGRRTEMDHLGGAISRLGRETGVPTPLHDAATCAVALLESRARGGASARGRPSG